MYCIQGKQNVTVYGSGISKNELPDIQIPGITWKPAESGSSLFDEMYDRLITRAETDRWYDAVLLSIAVFLTGFGYALTRYSKWVNGKYPNSMIPLYLVDKGFAWTGLWMFIASPFAGNTLVMVASTQENWEIASMVDKIIIMLSMAMNVLPTFLFAIPWIVWKILRTLFFNRSTSFKADLIDLVSMKTETGVIGFFYSFTHALMGTIVADPAYKSKWFQENGRLHGINELSMMLGIIGFVLISTVTVRSLMGKDSYMKLEPMFRVVAPFGVLLATFHIIMMGYQGWVGKLFDPKKNGQPSPTFTASMFPAAVLTIQFLLVVFGTKKRTGGQKIHKHTVTTAAIGSYQDAKNEL